METDAPIAVSDVDVKIQQEDGDHQAPIVNAIATTEEIAEKPVTAPESDGSEVPSARASVVSADVTSAASITPSETSASAQDGAHVIVATEDDASIPNSLSSSAQGAELAQSLKEVDLGKGSRVSNPAVLAPAAVSSDAAPAESRASTASIASLNSTHDAKRSRSHSFADFVGRHNDSASENKKKWLHAPEDFVGDGIKFDVELVAREEVERPRGVVTIKDVIVKYKDNKPDKSPVNLFVSVSGTRVVDVSTKKVAFKHAIHRILFVSEMGNMVGFLAKEPFSGKHEVLVFESGDAQAERIAITLGQAFEVAYRKFKKDNAIAEDPDFQDVDLAANAAAQSPSKSASGESASAAAVVTASPGGSASKRNSAEAAVASPQAGQAPAATAANSYESARSHKKLSHENLLAFADSGNIKTLVIRKKQNERLGFMIMMSGPHAPVPGIFVSHVFPGSPTAKCGGLSVGDQILTINGTSVVGKHFDETCQLITAVSMGCEVTVQYVPTEAIVEVEFTREAGQRLGFDVLEGEITSVDKGGLADRAGLCIGYRIIEVNGKSLVGFGHDVVVAHLKAAVGNVHIRLMLSQLYHVLVTNNYQR